MPPGYTASQKAAISQFQAFTSTDKNTAVKFLKNNGWNSEAAVNGYFQGGGGPTVSSGAKSNLNKLFDSYREDPKEKPDTTETEGTMKYLSELDVDLEGLESLVVLQIIQAPQIGEMAREGFVEGWSSAGCDTVEKQKNYMQNIKQSLPQSKEVYTKTYEHTFMLAKSGNQKVIGIETASAYWELLFTSPLSPVQWSTPSSPWFTWWSEFLNNVWKKSVNKDVWKQTLKFAQLTLQDETMSFWNEESSWPSIIDEFVEWVRKEKRGGGAETEAMEE